MIIASIVERYFVVSSTISLVLSLSLTHTRGHSWSWKYVLLFVNTCECDTFFLSHRHLVATLMYSATLSITLFLRMRKSSIEAIEQMKFHYVILLYRGWSKTENKNKNFAILGNKWQYVTTAKAKFQFNSNSLRKLLLSVHTIAIACLEIWRFYRCVQ